MTPVRWARPALRHLESIGLHIARDDPQAAVSVVTRIRAASERLGVLPLGGREGRVANTRELVVVGLPYIVVYRLEPSAVTVVAVMHTARLWPRRF